MKHLNFFYLKTLILLILLAISLTTAKAQTLFGVTSSGGDSNGGVLFTYDMLNHQYTVKQNFAPYPAMNPFGNVLQASDGNLYGMTENGGEWSGGVIFKITLSGTYTILANFNNTSGYMPRGSLTEAYDGYLYGTTSKGGASGSGTIFRFNISNDSITPLFSFNGTTNGSLPGSLLMAKDSNLYGTTWQGGTSNGGTIFKYNIKTNTFTTLVNLNSNTSPCPYLIQAFDGYLYGATGGGGTGYGSIFKCSTSGSYSTVASFNITNGRSPAGGLVQASDSSFYGMTNMGGASGDGTIFKYNSTSGITTIATFTGTNGLNPDGMLIQGTDGNLYGMSTAGGAGNGCIFKCSTSGTLTTLVNFNGPNGDWPEGSLIQATDGNLYGMTQAGGSTTDGVLFRCSTSGTITKLVDFGASTVGSLPFGGVIQGSDGNLYGVTSAGGSSNAGTIFRCSLSDTLTTVASFNGGNGKDPETSLMQASDGNLYGVTNSGGRFNAGTVFRYTIATHTLDTIFNFHDSDGVTPIGKLLQAKDGNIYGTTFSGGAFNNGVLFKITTSGVFTKLADFSAGKNPRAGLIQGTDGNLYGTTTVGSLNYGSIYTYKISVDSIEPLYYFNSGGAYDPEGALIQGLDGNLYGMTRYGGTSTYGTLYKCTTHGTVTTLVNFNGTTGQDALGSLIQASDSNLYGVTGGGSLSYGTLFRCTTSGTLTNLVNFTGANGSSPQESTLLEVKGVRISVTTPSCSDQTLTALPLWNGKTPYTYLWSTGATTSSISSITAAGTYTVSVSDSNGITFTGTISLPAYSVLSAGTNGTNLICHADNSGTATVSASGGTSPYSYIWNNGQSTSSINGLSAGTYSVTVTDKYGCVTNTNACIPIMG